MQRYAAEWVELDDDRELVDPYPNIRESLSSEYADLEPEAIEQLVESIYPDLSAEDMEGLLSGLKKAFGAVSGVVKKALPGVIKGATTGAALGPWGALAGGLAGGALSTATAGGRRAKVTVTRRSSVPATPPPRAINVHDHRTGRKIPRTGGTAASQFLRTVARPQVTRALASLALGGAGRPNVRVGNTSLPIGSITNALRKLLEQAEAEAHVYTGEESNGTPGYLVDDAGEYLVDPTDADERAGLVLELLAQTDEFDDDDDPEVEFVYLDRFEAWGDEDEDDDDAGELLYEGVDYDGLDYGSA